MPAESNVDMYVKRVKTTSVAIAAITFVTIHGIVGYWATRAPDFHKIERYAIGYRILTAQKSDLVDIALAEIDQVSRVPGSVADTLLRLALDADRMRRAHIPSADSAHGLSLMLPGDQMVIVVPVGTRADTLGPHLRAGLIVLDQSGIAEKKKVEPVTIDMVKNRDEWFLKYEDTGLLHDDFFRLNILRGADAWGLARSNDVMETYAQIRRQFHMLTFNVPFVGEGLDLTIAVCALATLAFIFMVALSHGLREVGASESVITEPWLARLGKATTLAELRREPAASIEYYGTRLL